MGSGSGKMEKKFSLFGRGNLTNEKGMGMVSK